MFELYIVIMQKQYSNHLEIWLKQQHVEACGSSWKFMPFRINLIKFSAKCAGGVVVVKGCKKCHFSNSTLYVFSYKSSKSSWTTVVVFLFVIAFETMAKLSPFAFPFHTFVRWLLIQIIRCLKWIGCFNNVCFVIGAFSQNFKGLYCFTVSWRWVKTVYTCFWKIVLSQKTNNSKQLLVVVFHWLTVTHWSSSVGFDGLNWYELDPLFRHLHLANKMFQAASNFQK